jgi:hypothetical protein
MDLSKTELQPAPRVPMLFPMGQARGRVAPASGRLREHFIDRTMYAGTATGLVERIAA